MGRSVTGRRPADRIRRIGRGHRSGLGGAASGGRWGGRGIGARRGASGAAHLHPRGARAGAAVTAPTEYRVGLCAWQDRSMIEDGLLLSGPLHDGGGPPLVVRAVLRLRRGQLDLLRPARRAKRAAVDPADSAGLPVQRQGLCAPHGASPRRASPARSVAVDAALRRPPQCPGPAREPALSGGGAGLGIPHLPRSPRPPARRGQARLRAVPDGAVVPVRPGRPRLPRDPARTAPRGDDRRRVPRCLVAARAHRRDARVPGPATASPTSRWMPRARRPWWPRPWP